MAHFIAPERYETDRFTIRSYRSGDGAAMAEAKEASFDHLRPWMDWAEEEQSVEENEALARSFLARLLLAEDFVLGVWSRDGERLLGGTGFHLRGGGLGSGVAEMGMWVRAEEAGRGLGTAVLSAMLRWGFTEWPWERLCWHCDARNLASVRTAEKAGMLLEGRLRGDKAEVGDDRRDTLIFGLVRGDLTALPQVS